VIDSHRFEQPQRLSALTLVLGPIRNLQGWIFPIVIALFLGRNDGPGLAGAGMFAFIVVAAVGRQAIELARLRWWVANGAFELRSGVLQVETKSVPVERIQNVDLSEPLIPRLLGLAEVRIETAGATGGEIALRYITRPDAIALREVLATRTPGPASEAPATVLLSSSTRELLIAGVTSNRIGALVVVVGAAWGWAFDLGLDIDGVIGEAGEAARGVGPLLIAMVVLILMILVGWVVSIAGTLLRYHGFVLTEHGADLRREHGLLTRTSGVIPIRRVQAVRIERPWIRRFVHRATVVADTAGSVVADTDTGSGVVAPIIRDSEVESVVSRVIGIEGPFESGLESVSPLAIRRAFVRAAVPVLLVSMAAAFWQPAAALAAVPGLGAAYLWARARYRAIGYRIDGRLLVARSGILTRRSWLVPISKVQSTVVRSSPFQRRFGLATLSVDTAGPGSHKVTVIDLDALVAATIAQDLSGWSAPWGLVSDGV
jgi:putative membrane protein